MRTRVCCSKNLCLNNLPQHSIVCYSSVSDHLNIRLLLSRHAAQALDAKAPTACLAAAMAKRQATDDCFDVANQALQLLGGYGYLRDFPIERVMRDLRVHSILEGTNEIMRVIISRELEKLYGTV